MLSKEGLEIARTICVVGHGTLPQGMVAKSVYDHIAVVTEVDVRYGVIVDVQCTLITDLANNIVANIIKGHSLKDGMEDAIDVLKKSYHGAARNAVIAAVKDLHRNYLRILEKEK